ncbi:hypothetical protein OOU_Y34scaffold00765g112 [Pyricularia oryzae Y34]|uniref:Uncharacterized protein n=2 Tax=Pyricularia oryzae TaxID=318829 RepID=A0AA97NQR6_PYRO3|nr:hypothetical protein OOU_Y34scaffold00765g112 [Pyricularia oryzae Y34]
MVITQSIMEGVKAELVEVITSLLGIFQL